LLFGIGTANSFQRRAEEKGIKVLGRDKRRRRSGRDNVGEADLRADPQMLKAWDGMYGGSRLKGTGLPALEGWYATITAPHLVDGPEVQSWVDRFNRRRGGDAGGDPHLIRTATW
jgi:hypothetical protein